VLCREQVRTEKGLDMSGSISYHSGLAAEDTVADLYLRSGHEIAARRWRSAAGEIDLIARKNDDIIFIEVKKSRSFAGAAEALSARQMARIRKSAEVYLGDQPQGLNSNARFDVALVNGQGAVSVLENAITA